MSFYGKLTEADEPRRPRRFSYITAKGGESSVVGVHDVYFHESGHVGFWRDADNDERVLILAIKAEEVWEDEE